MPATDALVFDAIRTPRGKGRSSGALHGTKPVDLVAGREFAADTETQALTGIDVPDGWMGLDIGPRSAAGYAEVIRDAGTVFWNGPMGVFEMSNFSLGTEYVARAVAEATEAGAYSLIGGGDSAAAVQQLGYANRVSYISTGGGALLEFMEGKELPGVAALTR